ncbi:MAG TPA: hypothetical protein VFT45_21175, partial [Longimicrobium sp.]|nr:hypothetical protein [Longimicrobium sp.]
AAPGAPPTPVAPPAPAAPEAIAIPGIGIVGEVDVTMAPVPGTSNWVQLGPTAIPKGQTYSSARVMVTGRVTSIAIPSGAPNTVYLGAAQGGVWKTTDGGKNWAPTSDNELSLAIGAIAIDPSNPSIVYAGTGEGNFSGDSYYGAGVLKSTNAGASWTMLAQATFTGTRFSRLAVTPGATTRLFGATGKGVYRSTDGGVTWMPMSSGIPANVPATDVSINPATPTTVYAAVWGQGIYRTTNASAATPAWTKLTAGLPAGGISRIALAVAPSAPQTVYALIADAAYAVNGFYRTTNGGTSWTAIPLPGGGIGGQGFYNLNVAVHPTNANLVYLSGISLWKATFSGSAWSIVNVGATIHPDNHALAFDPTNPQVIWAGNDGGIYRSPDGGATWNDAVNEGPCITQYEFIAQHPTSDAVVFGGTQDNGTEQFRNSPVFYHADDGDGGFCEIDTVQPRNVLSTYYGATPKRSTTGGAFGSWVMVNAGIQGSAPFYPPMAMDATNPQNLAFGTDQVNIDGAQGTGGWPTHVLLPGIVGKVSALQFVNSTLIYAGTETGQVYRLTKSGAVWTPKLISAAPLPPRYVTDLAVRPDNLNRVVVTLSGFGTAHVWTGTVGAASTTWAAISPGLPDVPANAVTIDPAAPNTYYVGTDIGVFSTQNAGGSWALFSSGLPNCAVFDLRLHGPTRLLRAATHGRGLWERRLDVAAMPNVDLFFRDNLMDTGRRTPAPSPVTAAFADPLQGVGLGDTLYWWQCADIKVDAAEGNPASFQFPVSSVDYVVMESRLQQRNAQRGKTNRVYVQLHNRGILPGSQVTVRVMFANASAGLPQLPADFWTSWPNNPVSPSGWAPVGPPKTVTVLSTVEPSVLEWDWATPATAAAHTCLLVVMDSPSNPIPAASKVLNVGVLVPNEKRTGLRNLTIVDAPTAAAVQVPLEFHASTQATADIVIDPSQAVGWTVGLSLPSTRTGTAQGLTSAAMPAPLAAAAPDGRFFRLDRIERGGRLAGVPLPRGGLKATLTFTRPAAGTADVTITIKQEEGGRVVGGNTFVLRAPK